MMEANVGLVFQRDPSKEYKSIEDPGLRFDHINGVYDLLVDMVSTPWTVLLGIHSCSIDGPPSKAKPKYGQLCLKWLLVVYYLPNINKLNQKAIFHRCIT